MNVYKFCKCGKKILSHLNKCSECKKITIRNQNKYYDTFKRDRDSSSFYHSVEWKRLRSGFINDNPFCFKCGRFAKIVDHIIPIKQGGEKLNVTNLQSLCMTCHNKKTKEELKGVGG